MIICFCFEKKKKKKLLSNKAGNNDPKANDIISSKLN
jgi:hypothetical protein